MLEQTLEMCIELLEYQERYQAAVYQIAKRNNISFQEAARRADEYLTKKEKANSHCAENSTAL